jgi:hypothetical protein
VQLLLWAFQEVLDGLLGYAILKLGIDPTKGDLLPCIVARLSEDTVMEASVVAVLMEDLDSCSTVYCLKASLAASVSLDLLLCCGGQKEGGYSDQQRRLHTYIASWKVCLSVVYEIPLMLMLFY